MNKISKIAAVAKEKNLDAILVTNSKNIQYLTNFKGLSGLVIIDAKGEGICFTDSRYIEEAEKLLIPQGYKVVEPEGSYPTPNTAKEYFMQKGYKTVGFENNSMTVGQFAAYQDGKMEYKFIDDAIELMRAEKDEEELEKIKKAQEIAEKSLKRLLPEIKIGEYEDELAMKLRYYMGLEGSTKFGEFMNFISGKTTSLPHGRPEHKKLEAGTFITIDFGAEYMGYQSDMTRTYALGKIDDEMKKVYNIVREAQEAGINAIEIGKTGKEIDKAARDVIEKYGYGKYFGHGLGHGVGMDMHELPRLSKTYEGKINEKAVVTVEPGIYIPGKFGVRIEDMIYIDKTGKYNLVSMPKDLIEIG